MAKNALALLDDLKGGQLPAHLQKMSDKKNIEDRNTVPSLGVTGKVFTVVINGEKKRVEKRDPETGDVNPLQTIRAIILGFAPRRGRAFYEGDYDPDKVSAPACWSVDGIKPHDNVPEKQSPKCDGCEWSKKGSKTSTNGKATVACSQHRMVVVLLMGQKGLELTPLRLKLAITSDWDKNPEMQEDGWFAFQNYTDALRSKGVNHTAMIVTKITFDPDEAYPKLIFSPDKWVDQATMDAIEPLIDSPEVQALLDATWTPAGVDGKKTEVEPYKGKAALPPADDEDPEPAPRRRAAPKIIDGEATEIADTPARRRAAPAAEEAAEPAPRRRRPPADDADEGEAPPPRRRAAAAPAEEEPAPRRRAAAAPAEEEPAPRRRKPVDDGDEAPAPRRRAPVADDEGDAPPPRRRAAAAEDEAPPRRRAAAAAEDAPPASRKPKAAAAAPVSDLLDTWDDED